MADKHLSQSVSGGNSKGPHSLPSLWQAIVQDTRVTLGDEYKRVDGVVNALGPENDRELKLAFSSWYDVFRFLISYRNHSLT